MIDLSTYRRGVGLMIVNDQKKVLVGKRVRFVDDIDHVNGLKLWQMPQGGIRENETEEAAMWREMKEEIGTNHGKIESCAKCLLHYDFPVKLSNNWRNRYCGQVLRWFLIRFLGSDQDINVHQEHAEFSSWKWVEVEELIDLVINFKQQLYKDVVEMFSWYFK